MKSEVLKVMFIMERFHMKKTARFLESVLSPTLGPCHVQVVMDHVMAFEHSMEQDFDVIVLPHKNSKLISSDIFTELVKNVADFSAVLIYGVDDKRDFSGLDQQHVTRLTSEGVYYCDELAKTIHAVVHKSDDHPVGNQIARIFPFEGEVLPQAEASAPMVAMAPASAASSEENIPSPKKAARASASAAALKKRSRKEAEVAAAAAEQKRVADAWYEYHRYQAWAHAQSQQHAASFSHESPNYPSAGMHAQNARDDLQQPHRYQGQGHPHQSLPFYGQAAPQYHHHPGPYQGGQHLSGNSHAHAQPPWQQHFADQHHGKYYGHAPVQQSRSATTTTTTSATSAADEEDSDELRLSISSTSSSSSDGLTAESYGEFTAEEMEELELLNVFDDPALQCSVPLR